MTALVTHAKLAKGEPDKSYLIAGSMLPARKDCKASKKEHISCLHHIDCLGVVFDVCM